MNEEELYLKIGKSIKGTEESQMFGKPCFKVNGKAFMSLFEKCIVFKLTGNDHKDALSLDGSQLFDPSKKGRAMREWVQVPFDYSTKWKKYAKAAYDYVNSNS
ncbi:MAG: hypothetical protein ACXVC7_13300 [Bacteroidia bacterium]